MTVLNKVKPTLFSDYYSLCLELAYVEVHWTVIYTLFMVAIWIGYLIIMIVYRKTIFYCDKKLMIIVDFNTFFFLNL